MGFYTLLSIFILCYLCYLSLLSILCYLSTLLYISQLHRNKNSFSVYLEVSEREHECVYKVFNICLFNVLLKYSFYVFLLCDLIHCFQILSSEFFISVILLFIL